jgi:hypothetical protein
MKNKSKFKHNEYFVYEKDGCFLYFGHPMLRNSTKINVNMVVSIIFKIARKDYTGIEYEEI